MLNGLNFEYCLALAFHHIFAFTNSKFTWLFLQFNIYFEYCLEAVKNFSMERASLLGSE